MEKKKKSVKDRRYKKKKKVLINKGLKWRGKKEETWR